MAFVEGVYNKSLKPTDDACHALCRKGKARATLRRLSSTVRLADGASRRYNTGTLLGPIINFGGML